MSLFFIFLSLKLHLYSEIKSDQEVFPDPEAAWHEGGPCWLLDIFGDPEPQESVFWGFSLSQSVSAIVYGLCCSVAGKRFSSTKACGYWRAPSLVAPHLCVPYARGIAWRGPADHTLGHAEGTVLHLAALATLFPRGIKIALETVLALLPKATRTGAWPAQPRVVLHQCQSSLLVWWAWESTGSSKCLVSPEILLWAGLAILVHILFFFL